jgi:hypothetical protein
MSDLFPFASYEDPPDYISASRLKVKRAKQHIDDINSAITGFLNSDFYAVSVDKDNEKGSNFLCIDIKPTPFPFHGAALVIGDALHNLRSALDILYYGFVSGPTDWTTFPIRDTREELIVPLNSALEKKQITSAVYDLVLDGIKPYAIGNHTLIFTSKIRAMRPLRYSLTLEQPSRTRRSFRHCSRSRQRLIARLRRSTRSDSEARFRTEWTHIPNYMPPLQSVDGLARVN